MSGAAELRSVEVSATTLVCTTICTLNCKNCLIKIPLQEKKHADFALVKQWLEAYFALVDKVREFTIMGGEAFLYPQFEELMALMDRYSGRIGRLFLITQASYVPRKSVLSAVAASKCNCTVHVDDYGALSGKLGEVVELFQEYHIPFDVRHYNEEEQYCGGWVDVVGDFACQDYEDGGLDVYRRCKNRSECKFIWDGALYSCGMHAAGVKLGRVPLGEGDAFSLLDDRPMEEKRDILMKMGTRPVEGCKYCFGWDVERSPRVRAAIQLEDRTKGGA